MMLASWPTSQWISEARAQNAVNILMHGIAKMLFCDAHRTAKIACVGPIYPDLPFLAFLDFLAFFVARNFLVFLSVFPFFPRDFRVSEERKDPCFFGWFPCFFLKKQGKEDQGEALKNRAIHIVGCKKHAASESCITRFGELRFVEMLPSMLSGLLLFHILWAFYRAALEGTNVR